MHAFLQIFLLVDVFLIGAVAATAARHAYAHFRPHAQEPEHRPANQAVHLPPAVRERLIETAQANFQTVLSHSADGLQKDLDDTTDKIGKLLDKLAAEVISHELERYRTELDELRKQAAASISGATSELANHQEQLKAEIAKAIEAEREHAMQQVDAEKQRLIQQLDTKLGDAVASFLVEALQHNVDLGAQGPYLASLLEEHKAEITKELADEA